MKVYRFLMYSSMDSKLHYETKRFMAHLRPYVVVEIKFAFFGRMERGGLFTVAKECNLYEFQMKKKIE